MLAESEHEPSDVDDIDIDIIVSDISKAVSDYYYCKDIYGSFDADTFFESDIAAYLTDKVKSQHEHVFWDKENYKVEMNLIDYTTDVNSNIISFKFQVITTFNYVEDDFETTISDVVEVKYNTEKNKIVDMYDSYDKFVRTDRNTASRSDNNTESNNA